MVVALKTTVLDFELLWCQLIVCSLYFGSAGLLYDREWMIQRSNGDVLTQKKLPLLCTIQISIDLSTDLMHVKSPNMQRELAISLQSNPECSLIDGVKLCGNRFTSYSCAFSLIQNLGYQV